MAWVVIMIKNIVKALVSGFLLWLGFICISLSHSAGFEFGISLLFIAAFHWVLWK